MDKWTFGLTMLIVGMGGTLLTLSLLSLVMSLLKKLFPLPDEDGRSAKRS
jgi:Na+-transporting methylmalonyl-CoA/oxaloacetate decarboxylase gamma subunit